MRTAGPLIDAILSAHRPGAPCVLGTLVDLEGSGYRRPGARLLIQPDGQYTGAISGGCLERDLARNAFVITDSGPQLVRIDTRSGLFGQADHYGTGCDGVVHLLMQRLPTARASQPAEPREPNPLEPNPLDLIQAARTAGAAQIIVTAFEAHGRWHGRLGTLAWQRAGAAITFGPQMPAEARAPLLNAMAQVWASGQSLGLCIEDTDARLRLLIEHRPAPPELVIAGTGPDAIALVALAQTMGWRVRVLGGHAMALRGINAPTQIISARPDAATLGLHAAAWVVLMTHDLSLDATLLPLALGSAAPYVGLLGPRRRAGKLMARLHADGRLPDPAQLDKLASPVGLDLGGDDPTEVALSILSQVVAHRNARSGGTFTTPTIHPPHRWLHHHIAQEQSA